MLYNKQVNPPLTNPVIGDLRLYVSDLDYYKDPGVQFPPKHMTGQARVLRDRRELFTRGQLRYESNLNELRFAEDRAQAEVTVNWYSRVANFWADALYSVAPSIEGPELITPVISKYHNHVMSQMVNASIGASVEGTAPILSLRPGHLQTLNASNWLPVVEDFEEAVIKGHLFLFPYIEGETKDTTTTPNRIKIIRVQDGNAEITLHEFDGSLVGRRVQELKVDQSGQAVVFQLRHRVADSHFGVSDYPDMYPLVEELNRRLSDRSRILTRLADPHMVLPSSAHQQNEDGTPNLDFDLSKPKVFFVEQEDVQPQYLTWDGQLGASDAQIERIKEAIYVATSLSRAIFSDGNLGLSDSGSAIRRMTIPTQIRVLSLRQRVEPVLVGIFAHFARATLNDALEGLEEEMSVTWADVLRGGDDELITNEIDLGQAGLTSRRSSISRIRNVGPQQADQMLEEIDEEQGDPLPRGILTPTARTNRRIGQVIGQLADNQQPR